MPKALNRIEHGTEKNGVNSIMVFNIGDDVKGVPSDLIKQWQESGAVEKDAAKADKAGA